MLGISIPYKEVLHWMTVAKSDSHQTNPWVVCAHWLRVRSLSMTSGESMNIQGGHLGPESLYKEVRDQAMCHFKILKVTQTFDIHFSTFAIKKNRGNSTLTLYKLFTHSLNRLVCFKLLFPLQHIGCI